MRSRAMRYASVVMIGQDRFEIQLGHACNNRCVFCVSGELTSLGKAPLLAEDMLAGRITDAYAAGHRRITLLGGEPTLHPSFLQLVRRCVSLGYEEITIFSNGTRLARKELVEEIIATGGRFEWRFSFQGATREAHERTTRREGSWDQLVASVEQVQAHGQRITINMCVVQTNYESVDQFAALLLPHGVSQLHVDMLNPYDTGVMSDEDLFRIMPRYSDLVPPLERMVRSFPEGFDVNVGNLPYCLAPSIAPFIHHGGHPTWTVTADDLGTKKLQGERVKYQVKETGKKKPDRCRRCVFDDRCSGVFEVYAERYGLDELQPVTTEMLVQLDPRRTLVALHARALLRAALTNGPPAPFVRTTVAEPALRESTLLLESGDGGRLLLSFGPPTRPSRVAACDLFSVQIVECTVDPVIGTRALVALWNALELAGAHTIHPPGDDAFLDLPPSIASRLARVRAHAPFGALRFRSVAVTAEGKRAELLFEVPDASGERVVVWLAEDAGRATGGYRLAHAHAAEGAPSEALVRGIGEIMAALGRLPIRADAPQVRP